MWPRVRELTTERKSQLITPHDPEAVKLSQLLAGFSGICNLNYKRRSDGSLAVFEVNARMGADLACDVPPNMLRAILSSLPACLEKGIGNDVVGLKYSRVVVRAPKPLASLDTREASLQAHGTFVRPKAEQWMRSPAEARGGAASGAPPLAVASRPGVGVQDMLPRPVAMPQAARANVHCAEQTSLATDKAARPISSLWDGDDSEEDDYVPLKQRKVLQMQRARVVSS